MDIWRKYAFKRISKTYEDAYRVYFNDNSKYVIMSDCHRGDGGYADNFARNQNLFFAALNKYNYHNYTYIELGDGDELWENKRMSDIIEVYNPIFWLLAQFYKSNRFYSVYGNHDIIKRNESFIRNNLREYYDIRERKTNPLYPDITFHEGLILKHEEMKDEIFLLHGHQADFFNDNLWRLSRLLVRYLWRPLETIGINDPTSAAKNNDRKKWVEIILSRWAEKENKMLIAGHTHRSIFSEPPDIPYFNSGSCVHQRCITAIEIAEGSISLVKWCYLTRMDGTLYVGREILLGPVKLNDYFNRLKSHIP
jgi:UDP-2,3-diacylglucosamine pyrophosphatase LpxH